VFLNIAAACTSLITIRSLSWRLSPDAEIGRSGAEPVPVNLIALKVHEGRVLALHGDFDAKGIRQFFKDFCRLALGKLRGVKVYPHFHATVRGAGERLHDRPVGKHIRREVDFVLGGVDKPTSICSKFSAGA
jgi:hypothetical protein